ncbi:hypothetical protein I5Q34_32405 [Streptomyces sp. AV19]|uniref:3-dehydroquinate synthase family protein n=1 Tax=Streptomyces sp. AV19 TaxID=2793068 RepID=UPI0018FEDCCC|nr:hypothetical protein [Streptomyces sp. AV19]MBH1938908.1 hypothetical protein [Streptomyces sp. AV19]MDG4533616.1 hypothetical protein [Streptomyces sp. AV19]
MSVPDPQVVLDRRITAGPASFPVQIRAGEESWDELTRTVAALGAEHVLLVTGPGVPAAHTDRVLRHLRRAAPVRPVPAASDIPADDGTLVVGLGGTGVLDAVGRLATPGGRGPVLLPTTLPAMTDTALSMAGHRPTPLLVRAQLEFLDTLAPGAVRPGLYALVRNVLAVCPGSYDQVCARLRPDGRYGRAGLASFIALCVDARTTLTCYDPREEGPAAALRYGHAVADLLRPLGVGALRYGDAVALGLLVAARCARHLGTLDAADEEAHRRLLDRWGAPTVLPSPVTTDDVLRAAPGGTAALVLLDGLGQPHVSRGRTVTDVDTALLRTGLDAVAPRTAAWDTAGTGRSCARGAGTPSVVRDATPPSVRRSP